MMNELVTRAIDSINKILDSPSRRPLQDGHSRLIDTRHLLNRLLEPNLPRNDWTSLFCRQLNRLLDNNDSLTEYFWEEFYYNILYVLKGAHDEQNKDNDCDRIVQIVELERKQRQRAVCFKQLNGSTWHRFLRRIEFERELQQRELHFNHIAKEPKSLYQLFSEYGNFLEEYLQKCISFHLTVEVKGLAEDIDDLLCRNYGLTEISLTSEKRKRLKEKLQCIDITTDCSNRSLQTLDSSFSPVGHFSNRNIQDPSSFIPSIKQIQLNKNVSSKKLSHLLQYDRWIVILGDPGSAKTTLLRWITRVFAETALSSYKNVDFEENHQLSVRIPILIRIGEFVTWLDQHETKTLMDYIGEHTWFTQRYCHDDDKNVLKELIYYGHVLVLLDGLDEIPDVRRRSEIVDLVRTFIDEHLRAPDFISAFDDEIFDDLWFDHVVETQPLSKFGGNQMVITSRFIGYEFCPLHGPFINHYALLLLNHDEAMEFIKEWMLRVEKGIFDGLLNEGIEVDEETLDTLSKRRNHAAEAIFENSSQLLLSNPALLVLICTFIFQLSDEFRPKSRIEVYNHTVQAAFCLWRKQEPSISESVLINFLINLANYLHLNSPSGLIDAFDMEHLCRLSLKQQHFSDYQIKVRQYANKLISLLETNNGIVGEKALQVFSFSHLLFQEYFVAQSLVRGSSIENIADRILSFTMNPRFRESLRLALGWISWKWPFDDYENFCNFLLSSTKNYQIPFGTLVFFDAYNDLQRLPSNTIIFAALNNLLEHPSNVITERYMMSNLSKLHEYIIREWMESRLKDEKCLLKFCQSFPRKHYPFIYQQLWSLHSKSLSGEFIIDQTLRKLMISDDISDQIFNKDFSSYFLAHNICAFNIHPLILSIIIAVCGGLYLEMRKDIVKMEFSFKRMHRESSILVPIMKYLDNTEESHPTKIQTLIKSYQNSLQTFLLSDTSVDIVDTLIALICLQGVSEPFIYQKYNGYKALPLAIERFKCIWFYFKELCARTYHYPDMSLMRSGIESIMNVFFSQPDQSDEERISFSVACAAASKKLGLWNSSRSINDDIWRTELAKYFHSQPECIHLITEEKLDEISKTIHSVNVLQCKPIILLNFLPQSLQSLYWYTTIAPNNNRDSLPFVVFLSQCLIHLEDIDKDDLNSCLTLPMLLPILQEHKLENYALVTFQEEYYHGRFGDTDLQEFLKAMKVRKLLDSFPDKKSNDWEIEIKVERQRISELKHDMASQDRDVRFFAASISLTRLFQVQYRSCKDEANSDEICFAITSISDPILRIIAWSIVLDIDHSLIFSKEQRSELQCEMISTLQSSLVDLSLLKSILLFIRCYTAHKHFPESFQYMIHIIDKKLNEASIDEQQATYIALRQLNNPDLSPYLFKFVKRMKNLSNLLQFNSTTFFRYFINRTSFDSSNSILLSSMYLVELAFDVQILNMFVVNNHKHDDVSAQEDFKNEKIMTFKIALWITNILPISKQEEIIPIIADLFHCLVIDQNALSVIEKWLNYRMHKDLRIFAYYAALQLIINGSDNSDLIDMIKEMLIIDSKFHFKSFVEHILLSSCINLSILRQILIVLQRNIHYSSEISVGIVRKEILELILNLEYDRVTSDISTRPFLLMINSCSKDLQIYLVEHLCISINKPIEMKDTIEEKYIAIVINWVLRYSNECKNRKNISIELYQCICTLLHDQRFPVIQKVIVNDLNFVFQEDDLFIHLENIICLWNIYSDDVIAVCLLKYGNCLLKFEADEMGRNISDEMINNLNILFQTSSSEIVSIRAGLCLILAQESNLEFSTILNWFENNLDATFEKRYKILLQLSLYDLEDELFCILNNNNGITQLLETDFTVFMERLIIDLYTYLCNNNDNNYVSDPTPDYVEIALEVFETEPDEFCDVVRESQFGEEDFKSKLIPYCKNNPKHRRQLVELYSAFGTVTIELVDMLEWFGDYHTLNHLKHLKQVSDHAVIEKLFQLLDLTTSKTKFENLFNILQSLVRADAISLPEIYERVSLITHLLYGDFDHDKWRHTKDIICERLLDLSCFKNEDWLFVDRRIFAQGDIDEKFEKERDDLDRNCALFSTRNNLIIQLR